MTNLMDTILSRDELVMIRIKALRSGIWFRVLSGMERSIVNLAIRVVGKIVRSSLLARLIVGIIDKLKGVTESQFLHMALHIGLPLAREFSEIAQTWGNKSASHWTDDFGFVRYLALMRMNMPEARRS